MAKIKLKANCNLIYIFHGITTMHSTTFRLTMTKYPSETTRKNFKLSIIPQPQIFKLFNGDKIKWESIKNLTYKNIPISLLSNNTFKKSHF